MRGRFRNRELTFECAPTSAIDQLEDLARDFFAEILEISYDDCLVTDESELGHFLTDETPPDLKDRFRKRYEFQLPSDDTVRIVELLRRIAEYQRTARAIN